MSLDIYKLQSGGPEDLLIAISDTEYSELKPAFDNFRTKTGLHIDQYSDLKLSSGVQPLIDALMESGNHSKIYSSLLKILKQSAVGGYGIMFVGE